MLKNRKKLGYLFIKKKENEKVQFKRRKNKRKNVNVGKTSCK